MELNKIFMDLKTQQYLNPSSNSKFIKIIDIYNKIYPLIDISINNKTINIIQKINKIIENKSYEKIKCVNDLFKIETDAKLLNNIDTSSLNETIKLNETNYLKPIDSLNNIDTNLLNETINLNKNNSLKLYESDNSFESKDNEKKLIILENGNIDINYVILLIEDFEKNIIERENYLFELIKIKNDKIIFNFLNNSDDLIQNLKKYDELIKNINQKIKKINNKNKKLINKFNNTHSFKIYDIIFSKKTRLDSIKKYDIEYNKKENYSNFKGINLNIILQNDLFYNKKYENNLNNSLIEFKNNLFKTINIKPNNKLEELFNNYYNCDMEFKDKYDNFFNKSIIYYTLLSSHRFIKNEKIINFNYIDYNYIYNQDKDKLKDKFCPQGTPQGGKEERIYNLSVSAKNVNIKCKKILNQIINESKNIIENPIKDIIINKEFYDENLIDISKSSDSYSNINDNLTNNSDIEKIYASNLSDKSLSDNDTKLINNSIKSIYNDKELIINDLKKQIEDLIHCNSNYKKENEELKNDKLINKKENEELKNEKIIIKRENKNLTNEIFYTTKDNEKLKNENIKLIKNNDYLKNEKLNLNYSDSESDSDDKNFNKNLNYSEIKYLSNNKINKELINAGYKHDEVDKLHFHTKKQLINRKLNNGKYTRLFNINSP